MAETLNPDCPSDSCSMVAGRLMLAPAFLAIAFLAIAFLAIAFLAPARFWARTDTSAAQRRQA